MSDEDSNAALHRAQIEQLSLQNEKLKLEVAELRRSWYQTPSQVVTMITTLLAVLTFWGGLWQYRNEQEKNRNDRETQSLREKETAENELMKPWLQSQREIYQQALSAAAKSANAENAFTTAAAKADFWQLYQGKMILVETKKVSDAMVHFGRCLDNTDTCDRAEMNDRCRALATAMSESMAESAKMKFNEFSANQFKYAITSNAE